MAVRPAHVPDRLVVDYDGLAPISIDEMLAKIEAWQPLGPIVWSDSNYGHWVVIGAEEARAVLSDPAAFTSAKPGQGITLSRSDRELHIPIELDGAEHRMYRKVLTPLFSPGRVKMLEQQAREVSAQLITRLLAEGSGDVVADFARPVAGAVFLGLVDWPQEDRGRLEQLVELELNPVGDTPEERAQAKALAVRDLARYVHERVTERRANPGDDVTSSIINTTLGDGSKMSDAKLVPMLTLLCLAGLDTTQSVLSRTLDYLGRNREAQQHLRAHPDQIPTMVEEFLRWNTPAVPNRTATRRVELGGVTIEAGDTVQVLLGAANRDPSAFNEPWRLELDRNPQHVAFSVGPHTCIGSALARVILNAALDEFHARTDQYTVVDSESHAGAVWGMHHVSVSVSGMEVRSSDRSTSDSSQPQVRGQLAVRVVRKSEVASDVVEVVLADAQGGTLPPWEPGAHIGLVLDEGLVRQYSLCGELADRSTYTVAVLREPAGRGGSAFVHDQLAVDQVISIMPPRNNFDLLPAEHYLFLAGGIGITPLIPMIESVERSGGSWTLAYGGRTRDSMAYAERLREAHPMKTAIFTEDVDGVLPLDRLLKDLPAKTRVYCCGPEGLLRAAEVACEIAKVEHLHIERFTAAAGGGIDASENAPFEVTLAQAGVTLHVPADKSILDVVEEAGIPVNSSCRDGTCATCETFVLEGSVDHRDSLLSEAERQEGASMMICVSRCRGDRLVLDL